MAHHTNPNPDSASRQPAPTRRWPWQLALVLAVTLALRLLLPGLVPLDGANAGALVRAIQVRDGARVYTGSPAGGDLVHPPTGAWLDALALRLWPDPRALVVLHGLAAAAATALLWDTARRAAGSRAGLVAAWAYAFHPLAVHSARQLSPDAWIAPVAALALHGLALVFVQGERHGWIEAGVGAGLALGLHLGAWPVAAIVVLAAVCFPRRSLHAEAAVGLGLGLLMTLPHLAYQLRHGGYDLLGTWGVGPAAPMAGLGASLRAGLASISTWYAPSGLVRPLPTVLAWLTALLGASALLLAAYAGLRRWARALVLENVPLGLLAVDWLILAALGAALTTRDLGPAGALLLIPAFCLCLGLAATAPIPEAWQRARASLFVALLVGLGVTTISGYDAAKPSLRDAMALRAELDQQLATTAPLYLADLDATATPYGTQGWRWLLPDVAPPAALDDDDAIALAVPLGRDATYLLGAAGERSAVLEALGAQAQLLPADPTGYAPLLYHLPAVDPLALLALADQRADVAFGDAVHLLGHAWEQPVTAGSPGRLRTVWLVHRAVSGDPRLLVQLVDGEHVWAEAAGLGYPASAWEADTAVIAWHRLQPRGEAPAQAALVLGWYDRDNLTPWPPIAAQGDAYVATGSVVLRDR